MDKPAINIKISGILIVAVLLLALFAWRECTRIPLQGNADSLQFANRELESQIAKNKARIVEISHDFAKVRVSDSLNGEVVKKQAIVIKKLKSQLTDQVIENMPRDSVIDFVIGEYSMPWDTLMAIGGVGPYLVAEELYNNNVFRKLVAVMDSQIIVLQSRVDDGGKMISTMQEQISLYNQNDAHYQAVVANQEGIIGYQRGEISKLKKQRFWIAAGGVTVAVLLAL
jgi:hypothetical protein